MDKSSLLSYKITIFADEKSEFQKMRVLIVNTNENAGGAAVAAGRLLAALNNNGVKAKMLVREKVTDNLSVVEVPGRFRKKMCFLWERLAIFLRLHCSKLHLWEIDIANVGNDITTLPEFREADVIHLSWVNQGMISLKCIKKIVDSGKPVVWTMHDLWPASSICHYARGCTAFVTGCKNCSLLPGGGSEKDLSNSVWRKKKNIYRNSNIQFVTCSRWLEKQARQSGLLAGLSVTSIPNPIDTNVFRPVNRVESKRQLGLPIDKKVLLFVAQKVTDERKGAKYLIESLQLYKEKYPEEAGNVVVALLGGHTEELASQIPLQVYPLGYVSGDKRIAQVYDAADVFALPSLEDNLPNTLMEALACGVPCVGFNVGGIPEMIDHQQNGYVAREADSEDLTKGLHWVLCETDPDALRENALSKVARCYSQQSVAMKYLEIYSEVFAQKRYRL